MDVLIGTAKAEPARLALAELLDVREVARLLGVSPRHVIRLASEGRMPRPIRLGRSVRWSRREIISWLDAGCPADWGQR